MTISVKGSPTFMKSAKRYLPTPNTNRLAGSRGVMNDSDADSVTMMANGRALTPSILAVDIATGSNTNAAAALDIGCVNRTANAAKLTCSLQRSESLGNDIGKVLTS